MLDTSSASDAEGEVDILVRVKDANRSFASEAETVWAARDVNLAGRAGEFVCIYGASGSGKSTLLSLIAGLDVPDSGDIRVGPHHVGALNEAGRARLRLETLGVVFQDHNLIEEFTALENVALPLEALGYAQSDAFRQAALQLARVGLGGLENRLPGHMSGGQRQRVGIARALAGDRQVLLADEPTGALDSRASGELFALIRQLCEEGTLAIVCSHDPGCREFADTVYEMVDGRLALRGRVNSELL